MSERVQIFEWPEKKMYPITPITCVPNEKQKWIEETKDIEKHAKQY